MATQQALTDTFDPLYYERMANSLGDKKKILPYILPGTVIDVGSGGGELGEAIQRLIQDTHVLGIDPYPHPESKIPVVEGYADEITALLESASLPMPVSTIIACSILHEVFSYGNRDEVKGKYASVASTLEAMYEALPQGGRLIVRDGIMPPHASNDGLMVFSDTADDEWVRKFLEASPFSRLGYDRRVDIRQVAPGIWKGDIGSLVEFAFTVTWGPTSFPRESQEFYTVNSAEKMFHMAKSVGFQLIHHESYIQPGYVEHLAGRIDFNFDFPDTNAIYVFEK